MKKISVIVPVYNVELYLEKCLNSLVNQTLKEIEIIIVNDGSQDDSRRIAKEYEDKYPDMIKVVDKENGGLSDARNTGIEYATGKYIAFIDSDDYLEKDAFRKLWDLSNEGHKKIVFYGCIKEYNDGKRGRVVYEEKQKLIYNLLAYGYVSACTKIYDREWLYESEVRFPKGLIYEDVEFYSKIMIHLISIEEVSFCEEAFLHYVQRDGSISHYETDRVKEIQTINDRILSYYKKMNVGNEFLQAQEYMMVKALLGSYLIKYKNIANKSTRNQLLKENWLYINEKYPNWKKNKYIRSSKLKFRVYFNCMNAITYRMFLCIPSNALNKLRER